MLDGVQWPRRDLRREDLRGASLRGANLLGCHLDDVDLRAADLFGANVSLTSLRRADLRGARLTNASFAGANLRAARLAGAELTFCDFGGAHLACADFGRLRHDSGAVLGRELGCPSFGDALAFHPLPASRMIAGRTLLAVDAAFDVSPYADPQIAALLRAEHWGAFVLGAMAVARRRRADSDAETLLLNRLGPRDVGAAAAVALLRAAHAPEVLIGRCPALVTEPGVGGPYRGCIRWAPLVQQRLDRIGSWPSPDERPQPIPWG